MNIPSLPVIVICAIGLIIIALAWVIITRKRQQVSSSHEGIFLHKALRGRRRRYKNCGHLGPPMYELSIHGEFEKFHHRNTYLCPTCRIENLRQVVVQCCFCHGPIMPKSPAIAYSPEVLPDIFGHKQLESGEILGCTKSKCKLLDFGTEGIYMPNGMPGIFHVPGPVLIAA